MKKELKEFLLGQQFEGDSTEGAFDLLGNLTKDYKKILMKLLEETPKKKKHDQITDAYFNITFEH